MTRPLSLRVCVFYAWTAIAVPVAPRNGTARRRRVVEGTLCRSPSAPPPVIRAATSPRAGRNGSAVDEAVLDRAGGRAENDDEQRRQNEQDQWNGHDRWKPG